MAGKRPYFPFYVADFASDAVVTAMTTEQVGAYILLLCMAWQQNPQGSLPDDDRALARWAGLQPRRWNAIKAGVLAAFRKQGDRWVQKRLTEEAAKLVAKSESAAISAQRKWEKFRQDNRSANADDSDWIGRCEPPPRAYGSGSESGSESSSKTVPSPDPGGGGPGAGESPNQPDNSPEALAAAWCFEYRGSASAQRNPYQIAEEFREWIENLGTPAGAIRAAIESKRDRTEPVWTLKERIVRNARPARQKSDGSAALAQAIASRETES